MAEPNPLIRKGLRIETISVAWMVIEAGWALASGIAARSLALVVFGADSVIELVAGFTLLWRLNVEYKGRSPEKVERAEKTASRVVGALLLLLAVYILASALYNLFTRTRAESSVPGIALAVASGALMPVLAYQKEKIGKRIGREALEADGACSLVCAWMSWILLLGLAANAVFGLWWIDSIASLAFLWFVIREGLEAIRGEG